MLKTCPRNKAATKVCVGHPGPDPDPDRDIYVFGQSVVQHVSPKQDRDVHDIDSDPDPNPDRDIDVACQDAVQNMSPHSTTMFCQSSCSLYVLLL